MGNWGRGELAGKGGQGGSGLGGKRCFFDRGDFREGIVIVTSAVI